MYVLFFNDRSVNRVFLNRFYAVYAAFMSFVAFADTDDLTVGCFQAEAELTGVIGINLEFYMLLLNNMFWYYSFVVNL